MRFPGRFLFLIGAGTVAGCWQLLDLAEASESGAAYRARIVADLCRVLHGDFVENVWGAYGAPAASALLALSLALALALAPARAVSRIRVGIILLGVSAMLLAAWCFGGFWNAFGAQVILGAIVIGAVVSKNLGYSNESAKMSSSPYNRNIAKS